MTANHRPPLFLAAAASGAMIAFQVGSKATRDALFLSSFQVTSLPSMVIVSSIVSVAVVLWISRLMSLRGPRRLVPALFFLSAALLFVERALIGPARPVVAILVYLHLGSLGALLISGFWSLINERFDPRTAKQMVGRIGAAGTIGGVAGGLVAERVGAQGSMDTMLILLGVLHLFCAFAVRGLSLSAASPQPAVPDAARREVPSTLEGIALLTRLPYLRSLLGVVILVTVSEGLLDFVFKRQASLAHPGGGADLLRLFAAFYTLVAVLTFVVQSGLARVALERLGLGSTVGTLPLVVSAGSLGGLLAPGLMSAGVARGAEAVLHNSLYRSGYELLFTPIAKAEKRATKTILDVGAARLGDAAGGVLVQAALSLSNRDPGPILLLLALILAAVTLIVTQTLQAGYRKALEKSLVARAGQIERPSGGSDPAQTAFLQTVATFDLRQLAGADSMDFERVAEPDPALTVPSTEPTPTLGPTIRQTLDLGSGDPLRIRRVLETPDLEVELAPHIIPLLAWDEVAGAAIRALRSMAPRISGQLLDALLNPDQEFAVRRRIPGILATVPSQLAMEGLLLGLGDRRFEVRYRCGRALADLRQARADLMLDDRRVFAAILREVMVDRRIWESQKLLDRLDDAGEQPFIDEFLRDRAGRSMEHVFTMLSLVLPSQPLMIAFKGLFTEDQMLRGTALEYLETALPADIRERLWPFLEDRRSRQHKARPREEILGDLMKSNESISLSLQEIRRRIEGLKD